MKVNRGSLLQTLEFVSPGLSSREVVEQSNSFCFKDKKIYTYDDETAVIADSPLDIEGAVPAEPLKGILHKMDAEYLEIIIDNGKFVIKGKGETTRITMDPKIELPLENLEIPKKWKPLPPRFSEGLKLVESCAGRDETQFTLTCIHLHPNWIEAYDTYQFARFNIDLPLKSPTLVRQVSIKSIIDLEMNQFAKTSHWVHFRNAAGLVLACRSYNQKFPVLGPLAKASGKKIQLPKRLIKTAERAEEMSIYSTDKQNNVRVDLKPGWVHVYGEGLHGDYKGRRKVKYAGPSLSFMIHPQMLAELVKQHNECEVCSGSNKALKAGFGDFVFVASLAPTKEESTVPVEKPATKKKVKK
jgi:hypothetical protein